jgi:hypothetical protein
MSEDELLKRITVDENIFGGKPIIRGMRMAVEHVLGKLAGVIRLRKYWPSIRFLSRPTFKHVCYSRIATAELSVKTLHWRASGKRRKLKARTDPRPTSPSEGEPRGQCVTRQSLVTRKLA